MEYFKGQDGLEAIFTLNLNERLGKNDHIFFSYIYPYTYLDMLYSIKEIEQKCSYDANIFFENT